MSKLCIYHGGCDDGFAAYWVLNKKYPGIDSHYGIYQEDPPDCRGRDVIMVDFSYKRPVLNKIIDECKSLLILDHHKSAKEDLEGIFDAKNVDGEFDMNRCGAMMAWDWFMPKSERFPLLLEHIQDRDLWAFKLEGTKEISMALRSYPQDLELWDEFMYHPDMLQEQGRHILRYHEQKVKEAIPHASLQDVGGYEVPVVNAPYFMASDLAGELAKNALFAAVYWFNRDGSKTYSLRSRGEFDVSEVAVKFGGGGHKNAAGYKIYPT